MSYKMQLVSVVVPASGATVSISEETDKGYKYLTGLSLLDNTGQKGTFENSNVNGDELFPKGFETKYIQSGAGVAPDERYFTLFNRPADGVKVEFTFKDEGTAPTYPYTLKIYLRLQNEPVKIDGI